MLKFLAESSSANQIGWVLIHSLWQFSLIAIVAVALQRALRRQSAAARYAALLACLLVIVAAPIATWFATNSIDAPVAAVVPNSIERTEMAFGSQPWDSSTEKLVHLEPPAKSLSRRHIKNHRLQAAPIAPTALTSQVQQYIQPWLPQIVMVWIAGVLLAALRPISGLYRVHRLKTVGISPVGNRVENLLRRTAGRLRLTLAVKVLQSTLVRSPIVVGYFRPVILLPLSVVTGLSESQLELILAHELAHVRRHDYAVNLLQAFVETLFFYHPAVWWLSRQIRNERENCCDDVAMASAPSRVEYGRALLAIEELRATPPVLSLAAGGGSLLSRIRRIAEYEPAPRLVGGGSIICVIFVSIVILAAITWAEAHSDSSKQSPSATSSENWQLGQVLDLRIIHARTKEPLPGVKLELQFSGKGINFQDIKVQTTDGDGRSQIRLPDLQPDAVRVYPSKPGFVPLRIYWDKDTNPPLIPKTATVPMQPGTVWGGVVRNEQGEPIPNVKVTIHYWEQPAGDRNPHLRANIDNKTTTGKDGRWRIDVMPEQVAEDAPRIFLAHPDYVSDDLKPGHTPIPVTEKPSDASLRAQTAVMIMRKGGTITGRVIDEAGKPIAGAQIYNKEHYWRDSRNRPTIAGEDGRFRITNVAFAQSGINDPPPSTMQAIHQQQIALVVLSPGYTPELVHTDPSGSASPLEISLKPSQEVNGRVVDQQGRPLEGVEISVANWLGYRQRFNLTTKTDIDGRFHLVDVPSSNVLYSFYKQGLMSVQDFPMSSRSFEQPEAGNYEVILKSPLTVTGSIVDAETGKPLAKCTVTQGVEYDDGRAPEWLQFDSETINNGRYKCEFASSVFCRRIRVEAEGYGPAISRTFRPGESDEGQVTFDFKLSKVGPLTGTILTPEGKPLAGAEVCLATNAFEVKDGKASSHTLRNARVARTDAAGRFKLAPEAEPYYLIVLHDEGYASITEAEVAKDSKFRIAPWTADKRDFRVERSPFTGPRRPQANN